MSLWEEQSLSQELDNNRRQRGQKPEATPEGCLSIFAFGMVLWWLMSH